MRLEDYNKKTFSKFFGLWSRGQLDEVPLDHFSDCLNLDWNLDEWKTRPGSFTSITVGFGAGNGKIRRFASFSDPSIGPLVLILDDSGNLYTYSTRSGDDAVTPVLSDANANDFSAIKMLNRIYITFHNGEKGLSSSNLKVFIPGGSPGLDEFRDAAGLAPSSAGPMVAVDGATGIVNAGDYKIAVSYITSSGFVTQPGPKIATVFTPTTYTAPGVKKIDLSNIPLGPTGTTSRQILITKADLEEYFFLSSDFGGLIEDNTTTIATLDFDDTTDLVDSADYLFDLLETIPSALVLEDYNDRLGIAGIPDDPSVFMFSLPGDPETFDAIDSIYPINRDDGYTIRNSLVMRKTLYIGKNLGLYSASDNGDFPSTWEKPGIVDQVTNVSIHGIAEFFDISGVRVARDWTLIGDRSGILLFDGIVRKPPITDKINDIWQSINYTQYHKMVIAVDEQNHKIYVAIPIEGAVDNNLLLMGDYNSCPGKIPEAYKIKWSEWQINPCNERKNPTEIGLFGFPPDTVPTLKLASIDGGGKIYSFNPFLIDDSGTDIESFFTTPLMFWESGFVHFFTAARLRVIGDGTILCTIHGEDVTLTASLPNIILSSSLLSSFRFSFEFFSGDGITVNFELCDVPAIGMLLGFQNGLLIQENVDYTLFGTTITMTVTPLTRDTLQFVFLVGVVDTTFTLEVPTGTIDGANTVFTVSATPSDIYIGVWQNGLLIKNGSDYTIDGDEVTFLVAPLVGDTLQVLFHNDLIEPGFVLETPSEAINGSNTTYTLTGDPSKNFILCFHNGLILRYIRDFYFDGTKIVFYTAPQLGDTLQFLYRFIPGGINRITGKEQLIRFDFQNEKAAIKFRLTSGKFIVSKVELFGKPIYSMRPA